MGEAEPGLLLGQDGSTVTVTISHPAKRNAILTKMQQLVHEKAIYAPIWQLGFINAVGPRVGESSFDKIPGFAYTAPFEDLTIKA